MKSNPLSPHVAQVLRCLAVCVFAFGAVVSVRAIIILSEVRQKLEALGESSISPPSFIVTCLSLICCIVGAFSMIPGLMKGFSCRQPAPVDQ